MARCIQHQDGFDPSQECGLCGQPLAASELAKQLAITLGALTIALLDKGLISQEEFDRAHAKATAIVDQEAARQRDHTPGDKP